MPDDVTLRMGTEIEASNHYLAFLEVFADCEGEQVLVNLALKVELFNKEGGALATGNGS